MNASLSHFRPVPKVVIQLTGSKSETNRLRILRAIYPLLDIKNESDSDDARVLAMSLQSDQSVIDCGMAGTAFRFLTAYLASKPGSTKTLTGSARMQQRPIGPLVHALRAWGARITYLQEEGFPPLRIEGTELLPVAIEVDASTSSQFITALLLIAPSLKQPIQLELQGLVSSRPYISMTLQLLEEIGVEVAETSTQITVHPFLLNQRKTITVESDWSSASYYYSLIAFSPIGTSIQLTYLKPDSRQGDQKGLQVFQQLGVISEFETGGTLRLTKVAAILPEKWNIDCTDCPDLAPTLVVAALGLGVSGNFTGLHTLRIKETDRIVALKNELEKLGAEVAVGPDFLRLTSPKSLIEDVHISTYDDHRMAMAFAPLGALLPIHIEHAAVVSKSYPSFWDDFKKAGMSISFES
ncbi:MAG: 3-phosphoshikimate 1-carboxyvinyltransferase [Flavobacterium sp. BFFFF2]|nr:MAG: 3-phosphoshikimate 1-carboxyvinyltransferase [Flavobacterium sp. BFFFF2]